MKISIDENYSKYFISSGYEGVVDVEQMGTQLSDTINPDKVKFSNADGQIIIPVAQEDSLMSTVLKLIRKSSK